MISVIIPVYNVEKYLRECLDSVTGQTYQDLEIILVDDGSKDESGTICDEYAAKDSRITVIHKENGGQSDARNCGLDNAHGEYIYFMDSDDWILPDTLAQLMERAVQENADVVFFEAETIYEDFNDQDYREELKRQHHYQTCSGARALCEQYRNSEFLVCLCLHLIKRDLIEKDRMRFVKMPICEDELFTPLVYLRAERITELKKAFYMRRLRAGSVMSRKDSAVYIESIFSGDKKKKKELGRYPEPSEIREALLVLIEHRIKAVTWKYCTLDPEQQNKARYVLDQLFDEIRDIQDKRIGKLRFRLKHIGIYAFYRKHLFPIKEKLK